MHSDQWRLRFHIAHHQRDRLFCAVALTVAGARILAAKSMDAELSPTGREVRRRHLLYRHAAHTSIIWDRRRVRVTRYCQEIVIWIDVRRTRKVRFLRFFFITYACVQRFCRKLAQNVRHQKFRISKIDADLKAWRKYLHGHRPKLRENSLLTSEVFLSQLGLGLRFTGKKIILNLGPAHVMRPTGGSGVPEDIFDVDPRAALDE